MTILNPYTGKTPNINNQLKVQLITGQSVEIVGVPVGFRAYSLLVRGKQEHPHLQINVNDAEGIRLVQLADLNLDFDVVTELNPNW